MKNALLALILSCSPAYAQELQCAMSEDVYAMLTERHGEARQLWAQNGPSQVVEFWAGDNGWTMIISMPDGKSCMVAEGQDWGMVPLKEKANL